MLGAVPNFPEVSSPELQGLLSTMRETVFLPAHLSKPHRDLVFGARHRRTLEEEPFMVEVAGRVPIEAHRQDKGPTWNHQRSLRDYCPNGGQEGLEKSSDVARRPKV